MEVTLKNINKTYGTYKASDEVSFTIKKGKLIGLLGPSGSGKTTILRMIAGLEYPDSGDIILDGVRVNEVKASKRGIGFVFQNYALFRYMNVFDNIAFGLEVQKKDRKYIKSRVTELIQLIGLEGMERRFPHQLSGGQRQRVAFARALAPNPQLLLLDEPFAAIDAKVRQELRSWLKELIEKVGVTSIFVTHDQEEAIEVADEIIITNQGRIEQMGTPMEIYQNPTTPFVAQFIGKSSITNEYGTLKGFETITAGKRVAIRTEFLRIEKLGKINQYESAVEKGVVKAVAFRGGYEEVTVEVKGILIQGNRSLEEETIRIGESVSVLIYRVYVFDETKAYLMENRAMEDQNPVFI